MAPRKLPSKDLGPLLLKTIREEAEENGRRVFWPQQFSVKDVAPTDVLGALHKLSEAGALDEYLHIICEEQHDVWRGLSANVRTFPEKFCPQCPSSLRTPIESFLEYEVRTEWLSVAKKKSDRSSDLVTFDPQAPNPPVNIANLTYIDNRNAVVGDSNINAGTVGGHLGRGNSGDSGVAPQPAPPTGPTWSTVAIVVIVLASTGVLLWKHNYVWDLAVEFADGSITNHVGPSESPSQGDAPNYFECEKDLRLALVAEREQPPAHALELAGKAVRSCDGVHAENADAARTLLKRLDGGPR